MKDLFIALNEGIRNLVISETEKRSIPTHKTLRQVERTLAKIERRLAFLEQEFLTNPPNQQTTPTPDLENFYSKTEKRKTVGSATIFLSASGDY